ncbi:MAG: ActS/PrrB/RegB family redox-sensitive histidine kinase [Ferrovibrio sp.]|uniref:ActS/PrrB/RegB family redox-sensitive histidine kinase n=1 Tax=Ferrovibrio sp. TaxID=1917215 RepID=UPI002605FB04|nr:ActS/PrrB/RegB family redox-sensitive histidine kinase [Ferrovibrio sp.]MCW0235378.1 ActS/PrrB/RegB family redox-sensitive histidine kinase [Ferrovibrio sp.]
MAALLDRLRDRLGPHLSAADDPAGRVRLQTLVLLRWIAIIGQLLAILFVHFGLNFRLPLLPALAVVGVSALLNIVLFVVYPTAKRLSEKGAAFYLAFDQIQLCILLFLTGGIDNPFTVLILVPVTVSATILTLRSTVVLGLLAFALTTAITIYHFPLPWGDPAEVLQPPLLQWGNLTALVLGTLFIAAYAWQVAEEARRMSDALAATQMALAREQQVSALGGLAAAAAHELGSPLGTIAVVVKEIGRELPADHPLAEDVALLQSQVERCRDILARLSRRPSATSDPEAFSDLGIANMMEMVAQPWRREDIAFAVRLIGTGTPPLLPRRPEILHGLGNLLQNAMEFARTSVDIEVDWDDKFIRLRILDDGPGLNVDILSALGEPYVTSRPDSGGMGLGVFIAMNLLRRSGASVAFANRHGGGTQVSVSWPRDLTAK